MASAGLNFTRAFALITLRLELLNHAWSDLLSLDHLTLTLTIGAGCHVIRVVSSTATAVRADNFPIVRQLEVGSCVELV